MSWGSSEVLVCTAQECKEDSIKKQLYYLGDKKREYQSTISKLTLVGGTYRQFAPSD